MCVYICAMPIADAGVAISEPLWDSTPLTPLCDVAHGVDLLAQGKTSPQLCTLDLLPREILISTT